MRTAVDKIIEAPGIDTSFEQFEVPRIHAIRKAEWWAPVLFLHLQALGENIRDADAAKCVKIALLLKPGLEKVDGSCTFIVLMP